MTTILTFVSHLIAIGYQICTKSIKTLDGLEKRIDFHEKSYSEIIQVTISEGTAMPESVVAIQTPARLKASNFRAKTMAVRFLP